jgi:hypothetical protein
LRHGILVTVAYEAKCTVPWVTFLRAGHRFGASERGGRTGTRSGSCVTSFVAYYYPCLMHQSSRGIATSQTWQSGELNKLRDFSLESAKKSCFSEVVSFPPPSPSNHDYLELIPPRTVPNGDLSKLQVIPNSNKSLFLHICLPFHRNEEHGHFADQKIAISSYARVSSA